MTVPSEPTELQNLLSQVLIGHLIGQAEKRGDYASFDFDPHDRKRELVHLDTSIDPNALAAAVIEALGLTEFRTDTERWWATAIEVLADE